MTTEPIQGAALFRLLAWLSPSYPVGGFSYSGGIEWAVEAGDITDRETLTDWIAASLQHGAGFCDAVLFDAAARAVAEADDSALHTACELGAALCASAERFLETTAQGAAFIAATTQAWPCAALDRLARCWNGPVAYPIAVAVAATGHGIAPEAALPAFLQALAANAISAGVRLIPLGQTDGLRAMATLEALIADTAHIAATTPLDRIGSATFRADLASIRHETQYTRLFRS